MAWDDGDKGNPWRPGKDKGPADLDAVLRDFQRKLSSLFGGGGGGGQGGEPIHGGLIAVAVVLLLAIWAATGLYTVDAAERGIVLRFGAYHATAQPGLGWHLPWPIESVEKVNIGETARLMYQGSMLTKDTNIVSVDLVVQYRRTDPEKFLFNMRDPEDTLADATASAIREVVGHNMLDFILTNGRAQIASQTQELLQNMLNSYDVGVTIDEVNLQEVNFPREVQATVQDAIKAGEDKKRRILEAQSYSNEVLPQARGEAAKRRQDAEAYRARVVADAEGEADRFSQVLVEYKKAPAVTRERMYIETLQAVLANSTKVLVDTGSNNNLLYLPLDQLMQHRQTAAAPDHGATAAPPAAAPAQRSREREAR